ncbi:MAG: DNA repair protein RecN [Schleiferiaceae bacterium]|nr:DNA repair protein RecN [Schleiferiaceae bacterium]MDR9442414.1 DNA repair protein RecN [Schleiferiaceae bacterium]
MLRHLSVQNFALIESLDLDLKSGFSTITGETGAGKSIILGALGLILGQRAQSESLRDPEKKCIVEGTFTLDAERFEAYFEARDLDFDRESIIRREISPSGKSRAFINDTPVRLDDLKGLSLRLIDVHSQHENLLLSDTNFQLELLDSFAGNEREREAYFKAYARYQALLKEQKELEAAVGGSSGDRDYWQFLYDELEKAELQQGEQSALEEKLQRLDNAGDIQERLAEALHLAEDEEHGAVEAIRRMAAAVASISSVASELKSLEERLQSVYIEMEDLRRELSAQAEDLQYDPQERDNLDNRLSCLLALQQKHQVSSEEELIAAQKALEERLQLMDSQQHRRAEIEEALQQAQQALAAAALELTESRQKVTEKLSAEINDTLRALNLPHAVFSIVLEPAHQFFRRGQDQVGFYFTANPGQKAQPLGKVASGGELSRVMLALKAIMARTQSLPTIIFDEIDTGVSGETAKKVAQILSRMGEDMQVISITHLPQIAGKSHFQYKVYKETQKGAVQTHLRVLDREERLRELARLLSGDQITEAALANARELLQGQD